MQIDYFENLNRIANDMDQTRALDDATVGYNLLADALVWSDEYPRNIAGRAADFDCVKLLLRYRTSLLLGAPDDSFKAYWDHARERFPNWAGFCSTRLTATEELKSQYEHDQKWATRRLQRLNRLCSSAHAHHHSPNSGVSPDKIQD